MANTTVIGKVTSELRKGMAGTTPVLNFSIGEKRYVGKGKGYNGGNYETQFWGVAVFGQRAESLAALLEKGKWVAVSGDAGLRTYTHNGEKRSELEVKASEVQLIGDKTDAASAQSSAEQPNYAASDEGIPF